MLIKAQAGDVIQVEKVIESYEGIFNVGDVFEVDSRPSDYGACNDDLVTTIEGYIINDKGISVILMFNIPSFCIKRLVVTANSLRVLITRPTTSITIAKTKRTDPIMNSSERDMKWPETTRLPATSIRIKPDNRYLYIEIQCNRP